MARIETSIDPRRPPSEIGESRGEPSTGPMAMTTPLHRLQALGPIVWYDNIRRALLDRGRALPEAQGGWVRRPSRRP